MDLFLDKLQVSFYQGQNEWKAGSLCIIFYKVILGLSLVEAIRSFCLVLLYGFAFYFTVYSFIWIFVGLCGILYLLMLVFILFIRDTDNQKGESKRKKCFRGGYCIVCVLSPLSDTFTYDQLWASFCIVSCVTVCSYTFLGISM